MLIVHFFVDSIILLMIEMDVFTCLKNCIKQKIPPKDGSIKLDDDV